MDTYCTTLLESAEKQFLDRNLTQSDFTSRIQACLPQACSHVYGSADFDLAGDGIYYSTIIQVALFFICGPLQALISRCISTHASNSTNIAIARFQSVLDTTYSTGTLLGFGIAVAGLLRSSRYPIAALERSMIRDMSDLQSMLQNLAMATYVVMKTPVGVRRPGLAWSVPGAYLCCQALNVATWFLKRRINEMRSVKVISRLCAEQVDPETTTTTYPDLNMSEAPGYSPFLVGIALGLGILVVGVTIAVCLPTVWRWIEKMFNSRILQALVSFIWIAGCLLCVGYWTYHITSTRDGLEGTPVAWDVGQVFVVVIWFPALAQLFLTILTTLTPGSAGAAAGGKRRRVAVIAKSLVDGLYENWFGKVTYEEDEANSEDKKSEEESKSSSPNDVTDEKAPLVSDSGEETITRRASPGAQV